MKTITHSQLGKQIQHHRIESIIFTTDGWSAAHWTITMMSGQQYKMALTNLGDHVVKSIIQQWNIHTVKLP